MACSVSVEKSAANLIRTPLCVTIFSSLTAFKILPLSLNFVILILMCLGVGPFGFLLIGTLCASSTCVTFSLIKLRKFSIIIFETDFCLFSFSPPGIPIIWILLCFMLSYSSFNSSLFFYEVFFFCSVWEFFSTLSSSFLIQTSPSSNLLLIPCTVFFISDIVFFISFCLLLIVSISFFMLVYFRVSFS
ncbi:hypothetical protein HJG60_011502 [Phyllostomus discolor]|uniref:Uncharacterized protein n=1 Tax=Phyllostomus discolor TaxID=89673 RepID=A0A833ZVX0_9CHIR|nr:hypothetical protein HJG60_011502 [Phyllostomus discolor]